MVEGNIGRKLKSEKLFEKTFKIDGQFKLIITRMVVEMECKRTPLFQFHKTSL